MVIKAMYWTEENLKKSQQFTAIAGDMGIKGSQLALAWVLRRSEVSSAIIGASSVGQIEENAAAPDVVIPADVLKQLDEIFAAPVQTYPG